MTYLETLRIVLTAYAALALLVFGWAIWLAAQGYEIRIIDFKEDERKERERNK